MQGQLRSLKRKDFARATDIYVRMEEELLSKLIL